MTSDGGANWSTTTLPAATDFQCMQFLDAKRGVIAGATAVLTTEDGGASWQDQHYDGTLSITAAQLLPDGTIYAAASNGTIEKLAGTAGVIRVAVHSPFITPNPATTHFTVLHLQKSDAPEEVRMYSTLGTLIFEQKLGPDNQLDCANLPRGTYNLRIGDESSRVVIE